MTMRFAASRSKPAPIYARGNIKGRQWSSHSNAICNQRFKNRMELRTQEQPLVAKHIGGTIRAQNDRSRNRRTDEVPFIAGCNHFTRKNTRFCAPASSPRHSPCNIHAAMTMRFAASRSKAAPIYARGNIKWRQWSSHSNAICNQRFKNRIQLRTQEQPLVAKHIGGTIRAQTTAAATAAQTRYLSSSPAATLHGKTQGFVLRLPLQNIAHATFMQPLQCVSQHPVANLHLSTHVATSKDDNEAAIPMQSATRDSRTAWNYAHSNNHSLQTHRRNNSRTKRPQPQPPHRRGTFHRRCNHLTRKNTRFRAPASSPRHSPCNIHAAMTMRSQHPVAKLHLSTHVATSNDDNEAAIPMQSATRDSRTAYNYAHRNNHSLQNT